MQDRANFIRRRPNQALDPDCVRQTVKHPVKIMIWGAISVHGTSRLHIVEGMMNSQQYVEVLEKRFFPQLLDWFPDGNAVLMHDGAPCHRSAMVSRYLEGHGLEVLPWPGNSPDMNPIEGLWKDLKDKISREGVTNKRELTERLISVWHRDDSLRQLARQYIMGMPNRIRAVILAKGGHTKY